tara:strand:- start:640 stop:1707 length:1068 start_codon:yes stop_codon:yes gene_type:complete
MIKILFDHSIFLHQKLGGISRYIVKLNSTLNKKNYFSKIYSPITINDFLIASKSNKSYFIYLKKIPLFCTKIFYFINNFLTLVYYFLIKPKLIHISYYNNFYNYFKIPYIMTVYDLTHEITDRHTQKFDKKKLLLNSKKIFCISKNTKKDLMKIYKVKSKKIKVVYLGVEQNIFSKKTKKKYILFVGSRSKYKNFDNLLIAFSRSQYLKKNYKLIAFGGTKFTSNEIELMKNLNLNKKVIFINGDDNKLKHYYMNASLFVFPSINEGFGLPILEAMRFGCPVACSNINVFREVAQNSCVYFKPKNVDNIKNVIERVLKSFSLRKKLTKKGFLQIKKFSWERCASETHKEYLKLLN